jgi:F0F1-type ATP synthase membrane subunit b/b'
MLYGVLALLVQAWCVLQLRIEKRDAEISENREQAEKARQQMLQEQQLRRLQMQYVLECVRACVRASLHLS